MAFLEDVLPVDVMPGASSDPMFSTTVKRLRGGGEHRNQLWANPLRTFEIAYGSRSRERIEDELQSFLIKAAGAFNGFRARDWSDYQVTNEAIGVGDGVEYWFRLTKQYGTYSRRIMKPDPATVTIYVNGAVLDPDTWVVDGSNGVVVLLRPPGVGDVVAWSGEFHVPVRFDADNMTVNMMIHSKGAVSDLGLREIRVREAIDTAEFEMLIDVINAFDKTDLIALIDLLNPHVNVKWPSTDNQL